MSADAADSIAAAADTVERRRAAAIALGGSMRDLLEAAALTEVPAAELSAAAAAVDAVVARLRAVQRADGAVSSVEDFESGIRVHNPVIGGGSGIAVPLDITAHPDGGVTATAVMRARFEGPAFHLHGGIAALLMDQMLAGAVLQAGRWGMTATLETTYRGAVPLHVPVVLRARVTEESGRRTVAEGTIALAAEPDTVLVQARAVFVTPREETLQQYFGDVRLYNRLQD
ncbi:PaaI family thioesterase [Nakamurella sp. YIM 132087]|uniref:PaaI family thioesterase n=1 Tax=Nakamurella alba TaxID=2665158 RepID=A0A7K1FSJ6_9ACTN|nr:PaaI family thioesterase [Nakamurella alba]MTD17088.1 PaaI family thioesterase [Nakamurella alba]